MHTVASYVRHSARTLFQLLCLMTASLVAVLVGTGAASAQSVCDAPTRTITANVVAFDTPLMFNRLGAQNINGMMYALRRDVIDKTSGLPEAAGGVLVNGNVDLRPDKRKRPLILRVAAGDCLTVNFQNLLANNDNPFNAPVPLLQIDDQVDDRHAGFHPLGLELVDPGTGDGIDSDASFVGTNANTSSTPPKRAPSWWSATAPLSVATAPAVIFPSASSARSMWSPAAQAHWARRVSTAAR
jgi:hypothetical protein